MCVRSSIVVALCVCTSLVAVCLIVQNVSDIIDVSAQLLLLCSYYYSMCLCLSKPRECFSSCVQHAEALRPLLTRYSSKDTRPNLHYTEQKGKKKHVTFYNTE